MKTVTYVPGTFVTLVPGPYTPLSKGEFSQKLLNPSLKKRGRGDLFSELLGDHASFSTLSSPKQSPT